MEEGRRQSMHLHTVTAVVECRQQKKGTYLVEADGEEDKATRGLNEKGLLLLGEVNLTDKLAVDIVGLGGLVSRVGDGVGLGCEVELLALGEETRVGKVVVGSVVEVELGGGLLGRRGVEVHAGEASGDLLRRRLEVVLCHGRHGGEQVCEMVSRKTVMWMAATTRMAQWRGWLRWRREADGEGNENVGGYEKAKVERRDVGRKGGGDGEEKTQLMYVRAWTEPGWETRRGRGKMTVGRKSVWCWCTRLVNAFGGLGRASDPFFSAEDLRS